MPVSFPYPNVTRSPCFSPTTLLGSCFIPAPTCPLFNLQQPAKSSAPISFFTTTPLGTGSVPVTRGFLQPLLSPAVEMIITIGRSRASAGGKAGVWGSWGFPAAGNPRVAIIQPHGSAPSPLQTPRSFKWKSIAAVKRCRGATLKLGLEGWEGALWWQKIPSPLLTRHRGVGDAWEPLPQGEAVRASRWWSGLVSSSGNYGIWGGGGRGGSISKLAEAA